MIMKDRVNVFSDWTTGAEISADWRTNTERAESCKIPDTCVSRGNQCSQRRSRGGAGCQRSKDRQTNRYWCQQHKSGESECGMSRGSAELFKNMKDAGCKLDAQWNSRIECTGMRTTHVRLHISRFALHWSLVAWVYSACRRRLMPKRAAGRCNHNAN